MSRTIHHRVRNTLNSVSLVLTKLLKKATGTPLELDIKIISEHIHAFAVIHNLLAEGDSDGDVVDMGSVLMNWSESSQPPLKCTIDLGTKVSLSASEAASLLQFVAEIRNATGSDLKVISVIDSEFKTALKFEFEPNDSATIRAVPTSRKIFFEALLNSLSEQTASDVIHQFEVSPTLLIVTLGKLSNGR